MSKKPYLNDDGVLYLWQKLKEKLSSKVDKVDGKGLSSNDYTNDEKQLVSKIKTDGDGSKYLSDNGTYKVAAEGTVKDVKVNGSSVITNDVANIDLTSYAKTTDVNTATGALETRIEALESLGQYCGTFDTYSAVPNNKSGFDKITINDFINVRADENHSNLTTRYIATSINKTTGVITWTYDITYSTDVSGKMDKVTGAKQDNVAILNAAGQVVDSNKKLSDYILASDMVPITNEEIDAILES